MPRRLVTSAPAAPAARTLGAQASFWVSAAIVCHTLWTSAAPAMTYPLYAQEWGLTPTTTTAIYAIYPIVVVSVLIVFGDLSDHIGRRETMLLGLAASALGVLLFALAPGVGWVFAGRALMGVGVGLSASPSTAAVVEFSPPGRAKQANAVTTAAQAVGYAAALLISGALIQYAPNPTRLSFWVLFVLIMILLVATWFLPRAACGPANGPWRFRAPNIPRALLGRFSFAALAVTAAYTLGALFLSLGSQVAHDLVRSSNVLINGAALALFALVSGVCGVAARAVDSRRLIALGGLASAGAMALLAISAAHHLLAVFLVAVALAGGAYSVLFLGGLDQIDRTAPAEHRGATLSALYLAAYLTMGLVALGLGVIATRQGLKIAIDIGASVLGVLGLAAAILALVALLAPPASPSTTSPQGALAYGDPENPPDDERPTMQISEVKTQRRVVIGHKDGRSVVLRETNTPVYRFSSVPGFEHSFVWAAPGAQERAVEAADAGLEASALPAPGGSLVQVVTYPPESPTSQVDPCAAGLEFMARLPGLAESFEPGGSPMHTTATLDYVFIQEGQMSLEVDDGETVELYAGDIVVQQGSRHGWRNRSDKPATVVFIMLGRS